jgi:hypothetical protein
MKLEKAIMRENSAVNERVNYLLLVLGVFSSARPAFVEEASLYW